MYIIYLTQHGNEVFMSSQTVNQQIWSKLFVDIGVLGLKAKTGVSIATLYKIKNDNFVPAPSVQRKLRDGLNMEIEKLFPFSRADTEPNKEAA